jgi:hypothetical protein
VTWQCVIRTCQIFECLGAPQQPNGRQLCRQLNTLGCFSLRNPFSMIHTRNVRIRNLHAPPLIKCPFRGCLRSFQNNSARTQHINAQHRDSSPQYISGPDGPEDAPRSPSFSDTNIDHYPDASPPRTPSTSVQNNPTSLPTQPDKPGEPLEPMIQDFDQPHTPCTPTPTDPVSSPIHSLLGSPFESVQEDIDDSCSPGLSSSCTLGHLGKPPTPPSEYPPLSPTSMSYPPLGSPFQSQPPFDSDTSEDQMRSPSLFRFDSPQSYPGAEAGPNAYQGSRPRPSPRQPHPVERDHAQDESDDWHQNSGPTVKRFHTVIDGATF